MHFNMGFGMAMEKSVFSPLPNFWQAGSCECLRRLIWVKDGHPADSMIEHHPPSTRSCILGENTLPLSLSFVVTTGKLIIHICDQF
jgi:hypothetical protein